MNEQTTNGRAYLEFNRLDDYIEYLCLATGRERPSTWVDITSVVGEKEAHGIRGVTYYAALTHRLGDVIATTAIPLLNTTNFHLRTEQDATDKLHENFEKVLTLLRERLEIARGKWTFAPPVYLKG